MTVENRVVVQRRVAANISAISERLVSAIATSIPAYGSTDSALTGELRGIARWLVTRLMELWVSGGRLTADDLRLFRGVGIRRANGGWPSSVILRSYRVGAVEMLEILRALNADVLEADDLLDLHQVMLDGLDEIAEAVLAGHDRAVLQRANSPRQARLEFLDDLLSGRQSSASAIDDRARHIGISTAAQWNVVVVKPTMRARPVTTADVTAFAEQIASSASLPPSQTRVPLCTLRGEYGVAVLAAIGGTEEALRQRGWRACVMTGTQATRVPALFRIACVAMESAPDGAFASSSALSPADAMFVCLIRAQGDVDPAQFAHAALGEVLADRNVHLMESMNALLQYGSAVNAAARLGIHVQTMRQRLRRVNAITGRNIFDPWDRAVLGAASLACPIRNGASLNM